jgi:hypothetical protein
MAPATEEGEGKMQTAVFPKMSTFREKCSQVPVVPKNYNVTAPPELLLHLLILPLYIINSLEVDETVVCLHLSAQPTWPQLCACFIFWLLSFLNLLSPPVRFLG